MMTGMNVVAFLQNCGFFRGLSPAGLKALAAVCRPVETGKNQVLFREKQSGEDFFLLVSGRVRLHTSTPDGGETVIKIVGAGETFGEVILFESVHYPVTATVLVPGILLAVSRSSIRALLRDEEFRHDFIAMLMRKQRYLARRVGLFATESVEERFFHHLREEHGTKDEMVMPLTKKDLAAAIGTTPETLSRLIRRLTERRVIAWKGRTLRILKPRGGSSA